MTLTSRYFFSIGNITDFFTLFILIFSSRTLSMNMPCITYRLYTTYSQIADIRRYLIYHCAFVHKLKFIHNYTMTEMWISCMTRHTQYPHFGRLKSTFLLTYFFSYSFFFFHFLWIPNPGRINRVKNSALSRNF